MIVKSMYDNQATIIVAETGAGKSTQVLQYLLAENLKVVMTQPRRLAAKSIAERVAEEMGEEVGATVGYKVAGEEMRTNTTRGLVVTDGLAMIRELLSSQDCDVLIIDEVHEWNISIEVLVSYMRQELNTRPNFRIVIMSATMETGELAAFMRGHVIEVPGRIFPVEEQRPGANVLEDAIRFFRAGCNVLVFQPGKPQIQKFMEELEDQNLNAEIIALHGEQTLAEQKKALKKYPRPIIIVATNVAETSLTIDCIDAVVDTGMERRTDVVDGVPGSYIRPISLAKKAQRKGRAGRTHNGFYVDHCPIPEEQREAYSKPEIQRALLDKTMLQLKAARFDMMEMVFFHQPPVNELAEAKQMLIHIGCFTGEGEITQIGRVAAGFPANSRCSRMLIEAVKRGVVDDVITVVAIMEVGEITVRPKKGQWLVPWMQLGGDEIGSDILRQLGIYKEVETMRMTNDEMRENGIVVKLFYKVKELRERLIAYLEPKVDTLSSSGDRTEIVRSILTGMVDLTYSSRYGMVTTPNEKEPRQLARWTAVKGDGIIVGFPLNLGIGTGLNAHTLRTVSMATKVSVNDFLDVAPHLVKDEVTDDYYYSEKEDAVMVARSTTINEIMVITRYVAESDHPDLEQLRAQHNDRYALPGVLGRSWSSPALKTLLRDVPNSVGFANHGAPVEREPAKPERIQEVRAPASSERLAELAKKFAK